MRHLQLNTTLGSLLGLSLLAGGLTGCEPSQRTITLQANGIPYHQYGEQDWWHYKFIYHPNAHVYYEPYTKAYYWFEEGAWHTGPELPREVTLDHRLARVVRLKRDDQPFLQHTTVLSKHPCRTSSIAAGMNPEHYELIYGWDAMITNAPLEPAESQSFESEYDEQMRSFHFPLEDWDVSGFAGMDENFGQNEDF